MADDSRLMYAIEELPAETHLCREEHKSIVATLARLEDSILMDALERISRLEAAIFRIFPRGD